MTKVLVLCYSAYGHIETMAHAVAQGARESGAGLHIAVTPTAIRRAARHGQA